MIADLDRTIRLLLEEEFEAMKVNATVSFDRPTREWAQNASLPAINFFLYDVRENVELRYQTLERIETDIHNHMGTKEGNGKSTTNDKAHNKQNGSEKGSRAGLVYQKRLPIRLNCYYMVSAWSKDPMDEHHLLTQAMVVLYRYPVIPENMLQGKLVNSHFQVRTAPARHDILTNPAEVWSSLENSMRATTSLVVTVDIDPWQVVETSQVETVQIFVGQAVQQYDPNQTNKAMPLGLGKTREERLLNYQEMIGIGGVVRDALQRGKGIASVEVHVKDSGLYTRTDIQGRFRFPRIWHKEQHITLVINPSNPKPVFKEVRIPADQVGDYDVEIALVPKEK